MGLKFGGDMGSFPGIGNVNIKSFSISPGKEEEATAALNSEVRVKKKS